MYREHCNSMGNSSTSLPRYHAEYVQHSSGVTKSPHNKLKHLPTGTKSTPTAS